MSVFRKISDHLKISPVKLKVLLVWLTSFLFVSGASSNEKNPDGGVRGLTFAEFQILVQELAPKVNIFSELWLQDPKAEFYGGTSRDFVYWVKGQFKFSQNREMAMILASKLRALPVIHVRDFIALDSDIDVISNKIIKFLPESYGINSKIDVRTSDLFDRSKPAGLNEYLQGYIPAEKMRLAQNGFIGLGEFGNGLEEIYNDHLTVHFSSPEDFSRSEYYRRGINHPILLALRFLRLHAMNYYHNYGIGYPNKEILFSMDSDSEQQVRKVITDCLDGRTLVPFLRNESFNRWLNSTIQKSFRTYTNPTAAMELMKHFKVDLLQRLYSDIDAFNHYLFIKNWNKDRIDRNIEEFNINRENFYLPVNRFFSNRIFYHGTKTDNSFHNILLQGVLPSDDGTFGTGLYGVNDENINFAIEWGGSKMRLVGFEMSPYAKIVDITAGEGKRGFLSFKTHFEKTNQHSNGVEEAFCEAFGIDVLRYPYRSTAFVVKNSKILSAPFGIHVQIMKFSSALELAGQSKDVAGLEKLAQAMLVNRFDRMEKKVLAQELAKNPYLLLALKSVTQPKELFSISNVLIEVGALSELIDHVDLVRIIPILFESAMEQHEYNILRYLMELKGIPYSSIPLGKNGKRNLRLIYSEVLKGKNYALSIKKLREGWLGPLFEETALFLAELRRTDDKFEVYTIYRKIPRLPSGFPETWAMTRLVNEFHDKPVLLYEVFESYLKRKPFYLQTENAQLLHEIIKLSEHESVRSFIMNFILSHREWGETPDGGEIALSLSSMTESHSQFLSKVLSHRNWRSNPLIGKIIESVATSFQGVQALRTEYGWWSHNDWVQELINRRINSTLDSGIENQGFAMEEQEAFLDLLTKREWSSDIRASNELMQYFDGYRPNEFSKVDLNFRRRLKAVSESWTNDNGKNLLLAGINRNRYWTMDIIQILRAGPWRGNHQLLLHLVKNLADLEGERTFWSKIKAALKPKKEEIFLNLVLQENGWKNSPILNTLLGGKPLNANSLFALYWSGGLESFFAHNTQQKNSYTAGGSRCAQTLDKVIGASK